MIRPVVLATIIAAGVLALPASAQSTNTGAAAEVPLVTRYTGAVRRQDKTEARQLLIQELRRMRDDLRQLALVSRGGNFKEEQAVIVPMIKSVNEQIAKLKSGPVPLPNDSQDTGSLDPILFQLQGY